RALVRGIAWTPDGRELIVSSSRARIRQALWRFPFGGSPVALTDGIQHAVYPSVSADGKLAFSMKMDDTNVWRTKLTRGSAAGPGSAWLASSALDSSPQFSPDGTQVAFRSSRSGPSEIWIAASDGRSPRRLTHFDGPLTG